MSENVPDDSFVNSIIGEGTRFRGEFELSGLLRIDGDFSGTIRTKGKVLVGRNGRAECTIFAGTVVVGGAVRGDINASEKVVILSTGMMLGNISAPRLVVEEGVMFTGNCAVGASPADDRQLSVTAVPAAIEATPESERNVAEVPYISSRDEPSFTRESAES